MGLRSGEPNSVFCTENNPHSHKRGYLTCGIEVLGLGGGGMRYTPWLGTWADFYADNQ